MGTATSRPGRAALALAALALSAAGCGGASAGSASGGSAASPPSTAPQAATATPVPGGFAWLRPAPAPAGWSVVRIPTGAALAYPPGWRKLHGDAGTATVALQDSRDRFLGYLNVTPRQGRETAANWATFRVSHNADEGERNVVTLAVGRGLRFRTGDGTCVRDAYVTKTGRHYIELACLVGGSRTGSVIVGAAPPQTWPQVAPLIERAVSAFTT
jgi:hypothetical protein